MDTTLILKDELVKFGFSKKEARKTSSKEKLVLKDDGSIIFNNIGIVGTFKKQIAINLDNIEKLKHRPFFEPIVSFGVAGGWMCDNFISFHEDLPKDSPAILTINNLWLVVPEFQKHLDKFLPRGISNDLKYDETTGMFYHNKNMPRGEHIPFIEKDGVGDIGISAKYNKELSKWHKE